MKKKIIKLSGIAILLIVISMLVGCGMGKVSKSTLEDDIISSDIIQNVYLSNYTESSEYKLKECNITKEQINKDDKQDIIFCDVVVENQSFNVEASLQLLYNYYDTGGWILESMAFANDNLKVTPLAPPEEELIKNDILGNVVKKGKYRIGFVYDNEQNENYMNTFEFIDFNYDEDTFTGYVNAVSSDNHNVVEGYFQIEFDVTTGWRLYNFSKEVNDETVLSMIVTSVKSDFSSALGKYYINSFGDYTQEFLGAEELVIESISDGKIKYSVDDFLYEANFDPFSYSFELFYDYDENEKKYCSYGNCVYFDNEYGSGWSLRNYPNTKHISKTVVTDWKVFHTININFD